jgi:hypothetical protein
MLPIKPRISTAANPFASANDNIFCHSHVGQPSVENASGNRCSAAHANRLIASAKLAPPAARNSFLVSFIRTLLDYPGSHRLCCSVRPGDFFSFFDFLFSIFDRLQYSRLVNHLQQSIH